MKRLIRDFDSKDLLRMIERREPRAAEAAQEIARREEQVAWAQKRSDEQDAEWQASR